MATRFGFVVLCVLNLLNLAPITCHGFDLSLPASQASSVLGRIVYTVHASSAAQAMVKAQKKYPDARITELRTITKGKLYNVILRR